MSKTQTMVCLSAIYLQNNHVPIATCLLESGLAEFIDCKRLKIFSSFTFDKNSDKLLNSLSELRRRCEIFLSFTHIGLQEIKIEKPKNSDEISDLASVENFLNQIDSQLKEQQNQLEEVSKKIEAVKLALSDKKNPKTTTLKKELALYTKALGKLKASLQEIVEPFSSTLVTIYKNLRYNELHNMAEVSIEKVGSFAVFAVWVQKSNLTQLQQQLSIASDGKIVFEVIEAEQVLNNAEDAIEPPTYMHTPKALKPFQSLVTSYDIPAYNTINPTFFVSFLFIVMFGLMFADAGQGLILLLISLFFMAKNHLQKKDTELYLVLCYSSISSIVFGVLFGSYLGFPLLPPIWFDYHAIVIEGHPNYHTHSPIHNIMQVMALSLYFGLAVIVLSFVLNFINRFNRKEWASLICGRNGLAGFALYLALVAVIASYVVSNFKSFSHLKEASIMGAISLIAMFLELPIHDWWYSKKHAKNNPNHTQPKKNSRWPKYVAHFLIEAMEFFINSLSNTLSFIRIAALGIAHIGLMSAFYGIAADSSSIAVKILLYIMANVLVIGLEGFSALVNSVRLNYYEFFSRYFLGGGSVFKPLSLNNKK